MKCLKKCTRYTRGTTAYGGIFIISGNGGIIDDDLFGKMKELGFSLQYDKNGGQFYNLQILENHAFIFKKNPYDA